jgi:drug/metabolite transporter (DMT)-like permease
MATVAGFLGVLIVLRPDPANFDWNALLPLGAAVGMSLLVIGNRMAARLASAASMQFTLAVIAAAMLLAAAFIGDAWGRAGGAGGLTIAMPTWDVVARCAFVAVTATLSHLMVYLGTTRAGAATIAPMTYVQIIVASALGVVLFGNVPDLWTLAGAAIIIAAGLYLWRSNSAYARAVAI